MNLKGGVIIIGSLLWDNSDRCKWRKNSLQDLESKIPIPLKIRYGRQSESRCDTYTMIFSNHQDTGLGQGYIVGFRRKIETEKILKDEATALAEAERIWTNKRPYLGRAWGAVGLLVNENKPDAKEIKSTWTRLFQQHRSSRYCHSQYRFDGGEQPVMSDDGFLQLDPIPEMNDFDFLLATPTVPKPDRALTPKEVADRMIERAYRVYFNENIANNITTFQDEEIKAILTPKA
jgi:hypothetical protein